MERVEEQPAAPGPRAPADGAAGGPGAARAAGPVELVEALLGGRTRLGDAARVRLVEHGLARLSRAAPARLAEALALRPQAARRLAAAFALGRHVEEELWTRSDPLRAPGGVYRLMAPRLRGLERETFHVLLLDGKHRLRATRRVSEGTLTTSLVHPREVFAPAVAERAAALIAVHNHPSGDPEPSAEDLAVTRRLGEAGRLLGIPLLDHVIVGQGGFTSLRERLEW